MELLSRFCETVGDNMKPSHTFQHQNPFSFPITEFYPSNRHSLRCEAKYIQNVAGHFSFSKEVIKDRGLASLSYHEWNSNDVYKASDIISQVEPRRTKIQPKPNKLCHVRHPVTSKRIEVKSCIGFGASLWKKSEEDGPRCVDEENPKSKAFLTEIPSIFTPCNNRMEEQSKTGFASWSHNVPLSCNEVLKMEMKAHGHWLKGHQTESKKAKHRSFQHKVLVNATEPFSDEHMSEEDFRTSNGSEPVQLQNDQVITEVRTPETLLPVYYKMPGYSSPPRLVEEAGGNNSTAETLTIKHTELSPPLRLQDLINSKAGKYVYATENEFEKELYSGKSKIIHQKDRKGKNFIVMESSNRYKKHVQESLPRSYQGWFCPGGHSGANWKDATLEQLMRDLGSVHNTHKISALITIATSAAAITQHGTLAKELAAETHGSPNRPLAVPALPAEILNHVTGALRHEDGLVRMAAALCQFLTRQVSEEARTLMFHVLESGTDADSWAAAQCLALDGNHTYLVIKRILAQLFEVANTETEEVCCYLLRELSKHTTLVHAMVGEALNSGNWRDRTAACRALAHLHGDISQDLKKKLSHLMWNDWSTSVRGAAAKALGKLGQGKEVHDQIRKHLECDSWKAKVEALCLIGGIRIMTAQLLPGFLQCFANDFVAVRKQACQAAGQLRIKDEMVMNCLYQLIQSDPVWKVQAHAIKALGKLGLITPRMKELLLCAVRAEHPGVRTEAYRCIAVLHLCDSEVQQALQDRLTLEPHDLASREVKQTLTALNLPHTGNQEMISVIKQQMPKLCRKEVLFPKVLKVTDALDSGRKDKDRLLQNLLTAGTSCKNRELSGKLTRSSPPLLDNEPRTVSQQSVDTRQYSSNTQHRCTEQTHSNLPSTPQE